MPKAKVQFGAGLRRLFGHEMKLAVRARTLQLLTDESIDSVRRITTKMKAWGPGGPYPELRRRSGFLSRQIFFQVRETSRRLTTEVGVVPAGGPNYRKVLKYAAVHEYGTKGEGGVLPDITPKKSQYLFIPVGDALTPTGQAKYSGKDLKRGRVPGIRRTFLLRGRKDPDSWVVVAVKGTPSKKHRRRRGKKAPSGRSAKATRRGYDSAAKARARRKRGRGDLNVVAVLKRSVAIRARPYIKPERKVLFDKIVKGLRTELFKDLR